MKRQTAIFLFCIILAACNGHNTASYDQKKASLQQQEQADPTDFLSITVQNHSNIVGQTVIEGDLTNKSSFTTYGNIRVRLTYKDGDGGTIAHEEETIDQQVQPGATESYKIKKRAPKGTSSVTAKVLTADVVTGK
jgi:hypothetical protein